MRRECCHAKREREVQGSSQPTKGAIPAAVLLPLRMLDGLPRLLVLSKELSVLSLADQVGSNGKKVHASALEAVNRFTRRADDRFIFIEAGV